MLSKIAKTLAPLAAAAVTLSSDVDARRRQSQDEDPYCLVGFSDYDFYVFVQSWLPETCRGQSFDACSYPDEFWETSLTIHGLRPDIDSEKYPCECTDDNLDLQAIEETVAFSELYKYWPNVKTLEDTTLYSSLMNDEWLKHGTCSGLHQSAYFDQAIELEMATPTPNIISKNVGKQVSAAAVRNAYAGKDLVILRCNGNYLAEVRTCWSRELDNKPGDRVSCANTEFKDNCPENITIASF